MLIQVLTLQWKRNWPSVISQVGYFICVCIANELELKVQHVLFVALGASNLIEKNDFFEICLPKHWLHTALCLPLLSLLFHYSLITVYLMFIANYSDVYKYRLFQTVKRLYSVTSFAMLHGSGWSLLSTIPMIPVSMVTVTSLVGGSPSGLWVA